MKTVQQTIQPIITSMVAILVACSSSSLDGGSVAKIKVIADPGVSVIGNGLNTGTNEFEQADIVITDIRFELSQNCSSGSDDTRIDLEGPFVVDLLAEKSHPSLDEVQLEKGKYCKFKFKLDKLDDDEVPSGVDNEMIDKSVLIKGNHDGDIPFVVTLDRNEEFELDAEDSEGFSLTPDQTNTVFLVFNLSKLFEGIDITTLDQTGGTVYIDEDNNEDAYDIVRDNLKRFSELFKDSNDDDELDDDDDNIASGD
jgi:hypothetical protein